MKQNQAMIDSITSIELDHKGAIVKVIGKCKAKHFKKKGVENGR